MLDIKHPRPLTSLARAGLLVASIALSSIHLIACDGTDAVPAIDAAGDGQAVAPELTWVETALAPDLIGAGESTLVTCTGKDQYDAAFTPDLPFEFDVFDANNNTPDGITISNDRITAAHAGVIRVRCRYPGTPPLVDQSPVSLTVQAGPPVSIRTTILRTNLTAGDRINVACSARDAQDNNASAEMVVRVSPELGVTTTGNAVRFTRVGDFTVRCALTDNSLVGNTIDVNVKPAALSVLETVLSKDTITPLEEVTVSCPGRDEFGNAVNLDKVITLPVSNVTGLDVDRTRITATMAGVYPITCAPKESWVTATRLPASLTVIAGPPVAMTLDLSPDRAVYGLGVRPMVTPKLRDAYGNTVADTSTISIEVRHGATLRETIVGGQRTTLDAEGTWTLTAKSGPPSNLTTARVLIVDGSAPTVDITYPARGQMVVTTGGSLRMRGEIRDDTGGLTSVKINGAARSITHGQNRFEIDMPISPRHGLNTITIEATDVQGHVVKVVQGYLAAPGYKTVAQTFNDGIIVHLSRLFIDDGNRSGRADDLATIFERVIASFNISDYVPSPVVTYAGYDVFLRNVTYSPPKVAITPAKDKLVFDVDINNLRIDVHADGFIDASGTVTASAVRVDMDLGITIVAGRPRVTAQAIVVNIDDLRIDVHWSINWIISLFTNTIRDSIIDSFTSTLRQEIPPAIEDALAGFAIDETFEVPAFLPGMAPLNVRLQAKPDHLVINERELDLALGTQVTAAKRVPWTTAGSLMRGGCFAVDGGMPTWNAQKKMTMALSTDVLNQVLHAVWQGGALELTVPASMLADADLSQFGITDLRVDVSARLPPLLTDCEDGQLRIQLGELNIDASLKMGGSPLAVSMVVYFETTADVDVDASGSIALSIGTIAPEDILIDITRIESDLFGPDQEDALVNLLRDQVLTGLLEGFAGEGLADFPLPELDLGGMSPALAGQVISLQNIVLGRSRGYLLLEGSP